MRSIEQIWNETNDAGEGFAEADWPEEWDRRELQKVVGAEGWEYVGTTGDRNEYVIWTREGEVLIIADAHGPWGAQVSGKLVFPVTGGVFVEEETD